MNDKTIEELQIEELQKVISTLEIRGADISQQKVDKIIATLKTTIEVLKGSN